MSSDLLDRFRRGDLDERELTAILTHLETCDDCARRGQAAVAHDVTLLREELTGAAPPARRRAILWTSVAAAAAALIVLAVLLAYAPSPPPAAPATSPVARGPLPTPAPAPAATVTSPAATVTSPAATVTSPAATVTSPPTRAARLEPEWQRLVSAAAANGRLPFPSYLARLQAPADTLRSPGGAMERIAPAGIVVDEVRPEFEWPAREGATSVVSVFDGGRELIRSAPLRGSRWTPDRDLPRGRVLAWQVEVARDGVIETIPRPPAPPALFRIARAAEQREIERARTQHPDEHLLQAVLYARAGMREQALAALRRAAATNSTAKRILDHETSTAQ